MTHDMTQDVTTLKARLDQLRPLGRDALAQLEHYYDVQLTYTSNAIEGNTLTYGETALVIEKGITVGGKPLNDHLEAVDLYQAIRFIRSAASATTPIDEAMICDLHARIVARSRPDIAGLYSPFRRRVAGSTVVFPNPAKVPALMSALAARLAPAQFTPAQPTPAQPTPAQPTPSQSTPETAFDAHLELVSIHPFSDGNGRTARLLMNLVLMHGGYPPIAISPESRTSYISAIETAQLTGIKSDYTAFMTNCLTVTLIDYIDAITETKPFSP